MFHFIFVILCCTIFTNASDVNEYTPAEKVALEKFRPLVEDDLMHDYMREDVYLIRFLRAKDYDIHDSAESIRATMKWRTHNNIDNILNEDFSDISKQMPAHFDGVDKEGRPFSILNVGRWDIRKFTVVGIRNNVTRYWDRILEGFEVKIRELGNNGTNVTQGICIMNIDGYNVKQHGCFSCGSVYIEWLGHYEHYYPELLKNLIMINAPRIFGPLLKMLKPFMSPSTRKVLQTLGPDKKEWSKELLTMISPDQLTPQYGGTKSS